MAPSSVQIPAVVLAIVLTVVFIVALAVNSDGRNNSEQCEYIDQDVLTDC